MALRLLYLIVTRVFGWLALLGPVVLSRPALPQKDSYISCLTQAWQREVRADLKYRAGLH